MRHKEIVQITPSTHAHVQPLSFFLSPPSASLLTGTSSLFISAA